MPDDSKTKKGSASKGDDEGDDTAKESALSWILSKDTPSDEVREVCQQLFGKGDTPVEMDKIHNVQKQLYSEAKKRDKKGVNSIQGECTGRLYFMVDNPCKQGCPDSSPHMHTRTGECQAEESEHTIPCDADSARQMKLPQLRLFAPGRSLRSTARPRRPSSREGGPGGSHRGARERLEHTCTGVAAKRLFRLFRLLALPRFC